MELSIMQQRMLEQSCPKCGEGLQEIGDLADFEHNLIAHGNDNKCDYVMFYDGTEQ